MMRVCRQAIAVVGLVGALTLAACGSTNSGGNSDNLVLAFIGFSDMNISQCDAVNPEVADIDLVQDECVSGGMSTPEPFTQTSATATLQNNEKLNITINSYTVDYQQTGVAPITQQTSQIVVGRRCSNNATVPCAVDSDCLSISGGAGTCLASQSTIQVLLADFNTKAFLLPDIGNTVPLVVTFFGSDDANNDWQTQGTISATLEDFNNCGCMLTQ